MGGSGRCRTRCRGAIGVNGSMSARSRARVVHVTRERKHTKVGPKGRLHLGRITARRAQPQGERGRPSMRGALVVLLSAHGASAHVAHAPPNFLRAPRPILANAHRFVDATLRRTPQSRTVSARARRKVQHSQPQQAPRSVLGLRNSCCVVSPSPLEYPEQWYTRANMSEELAMDDVMR